MTRALDVTNGVNQLMLSPPHMALNSHDTPALYTMQRTFAVPEIMPASAMIDQIASAGRLNHLVISAHGGIVVQKMPDGSPGPMTNVKVYLGQGFDWYNVDLFAGLRAVLEGGVLWFGACNIGNDPKNAERAKSVGCYVVAPIMNMSDRQHKHVVFPFGKMDMYDRFQPIVTAPDGVKIRWSAFLRAADEHHFSFDPG